MKHARDNLDLSIFFLTRTEKEEQRRNKTALDNHHTAISENTCAEIIFNISGDEKDWDVGMSQDFKNISVELFKKVEKRI